MRVVECMQSHVGIYNEKNKLIEVIQLPYKVKDTNIFPAKLRPLYALMLSMMAIGMYTPASAAVIDYNDGEDKAFSEH